MKSNGDFQHNKKTDAQQNKKHSWRWIYILVAGISFVLMILSWHKVYTPPQLALPAGALLVLVAIIMTVAFWLMDRHWYHRLLLGAVDHGRSIEDSLNTTLPQIGLTVSIGRKSPIRKMGMLIRSSQKVSFFYFVAFLGLLVLLIIVLFSVRPVSTKNAPHGSSQATSTSPQQQTKPSRVKP